MDLSRISIAARQRTPWEALDLGILLARKWYRPLMLAWILPSSIVFFTLSIIFYDSLWIATMVTWWLKPLWDRFPLYVASHAMFGEKISAFTAFKNFFSIIKKDWLAWLTWRRLSFSRSFDMPVTVLEGLKGKERRKRLHVLHMKSSSAASWLTIICVHIETALVFGGAGLIYMFIPEEVDVNILEYIGSEEYIASLIYSLGTYAAMVVVAPFYVLAGFTLYISRRITLEGWDIEIRFRHLASLHKTNEQAQPGQGVKKVRNAAPVQNILLVLCVPFVLMHASDASSSTNEANHVKPVEMTMEASAARKSIKDILNGKDFNQQEIRKKWRFKNTEEISDDDEIPAWVIRLLEFFENYNAKAKDSEAKSDNTIILIAKILEFIFWVAVIFLIFFLLYYYRHYLQSLVGKLGFKKDELPPRPEVIFGLDVREKSIPDDMAKKALQMWRDGMARDALGLLYRATLSRLIYQYHFQFTESTTELECVNIVSQSSSPELDSYVRRLTSSWQLLAYGHRKPEEQDVIALCEQWPEVFANEN